MIQPIQLLLMTGLYPYLYRHLLIERNRNRLIIVSFDLRVLHVQCGLDGSAADVTVYNDARSIDFPIPTVKLYLAAGYPACRGVRYHLAEWKCADLKDLPLNVDSGHSPHFILDVKPKKSYSILCAQCR
jgi:hypothetical protein